MGDFVVGGFQHETNTFSPNPATPQAFEQPDAWPAWLVGEELLTGFVGQNLPIAGALDAFKGQGHRITPIAWANAPPSGRVQQEVFDRFAQQCLQTLANTPQANGLYLDLHGAMVTDAHDDAEGVLVSIIRQHYPQLPIVVSLDFHANVSRTLFENTQALLAYRTYPHVDMAETGKKAAEVLMRLEQWPAKAFLPLDFLIPLAGQCTLVDPMRALFQTLQALDSSAQAQLSFAPGFPLADVPCSQPTLFGVGKDQKKLDAALHTLSQAIEEVKPQLNPPLLSPEQALMASTAPGPTIWVDTQDNSGAGGTSDTMGVARALVSSQRKAIVGVIYDPLTAQQAHEVGVGARFDAQIGGKHVPGGPPLEAKAQVLAIGDGEVLCQGGYYRGCRMALGPMAALKVGNTVLVLSSKRVQAADRSLFTCLGQKVEDFQIVSLKSSVHFRADFQDLAQDIVLVEAPGLNIADLGRLSYQKCKARIITNKS